MILHSQSHIMISILNITSVKSLKLDPINKGRDSRNKREKIISFLIFLLHRFVGQKMDKLHDICDSSFVCSQELRNISLILLPKITKSKNSLLYGTSSEILKWLNKILQDVLSHIVYSNALAPIRNKYLEKCLLIRLERVSSFVTITIITAWPTAEKSKLHQCPSKLPISITLNTLCCDVVMLTYYTWLRKMVLTTTLQ